MGCQRSDCLRKARYLTHSIAAGGVWRLCAVSCRSLPLVLRQVPAMPGNGQRTDVTGRQL